MLNVKYTVHNDYSVQNDESMRGHRTYERRVRNRDKKVRTDEGQRKWREREREATVTCDERLFRRRAAATGNALSPTVDKSRVRTSNFQRR